MMSQPVLKAISLSTCLLLCLLMITGCHSAAKNQSVQLPARHSVSAEQLIVLSDFKLGQDHELFQDLIKLREDVAETLNIPLNSEQVTVYLFTNELEYRNYLDTTYPGLPPRRAYFVGTPKELAVYTFWGERIQEDLRHEFTHGLLHASLKTVPLWLDEGLAEYFEVAGNTPGQINRDHAARLTTALNNGWKPDMKRLEQLEKVSQMQRVDYQEAWAWVHFMLNGTPETKDTLLEYLAELKTNEEPEALSARLPRDIPGVDQRFVSYVASLNTFPSR
ncbi:MAG: DUF1570 domain-containing protein [Planctomycetes bacterium]|nr:DUF1570 domain-containing protein [Planctomycetota bacterium]MCH9727454.1 DUF1570 domain-containing protein [Planctomycetota bacterium]MCH9775959.1 DUF1570 domain-containing protein [Planctomycetota bacterium]MCH9791076.1 DUF1570 domain-containing protein [Planctomycetota bacterium]MDF1743479.1 DUF1570 domain-containing protein [Gimesia sp.]